MQADKAVREPVQGCEAADRPAAEEEREHHKIARVPNRVRGAREVIEESSVHQEREETVDHGAELGGVREVL